MDTGQLQKMGILDSSKQPKATPAKRRSTQLDFSNLPPLKQGGTVGFTAFRDTDEKPKARRKSNGNMADIMADDSEEEEDDSEVTGKAEDLDEKDPKFLLSPDDAKKQGELAEGVGRIKVSTPQCVLSFRVAHKLHSSNVNIPLNP
jgi:hypothetical protein